MDDVDRVDPGDARLQAMLFSMAGYSRYPDHRSKLIDFALTCPPLATWPTSALEQLNETCQYVVSLARMSRELQQLVTEE